MRITLQTKIWSTIVLIVLMFSFFTLYYFPRQQEKYLLDNYNNEVQNLANTISLGVKIALTEENFEGVQTALGFVKDDPRLHYVTLLATDTAWNSDHSNYKLKESVLQTFPENGLADSASIDPNSIIKKRSSFNTDMMNGAVELGLNTDKIEQDKKKIRSASILVSGVVFAFGILIGFWLSRNISVPVLALRDAANKVGQGDLTQRVKNTSGDEIGELASAFNRMVEDLCLAREELNKANADLHAANETLQKTLEELNEAQDQLIQSEKMASLGQLTAGIAHEINNPINFITANIQPLKDDLNDILEMLNTYDKVVTEKLPESEHTEIIKAKQDVELDLAKQEVHDLLKGMEEGARRTAEIVKSLRNFSRMDQNVFADTDINESLQASLTLLYGTYKKRIEVVKEFGEIPRTDCLPGQINQVFMNILSNAFQAIPDKGTIFIKTWAENDKVKVSIRDTGTGMTEEAKKKIFDPFFTTKDVGKGTGLGMSISFGIIRKHNGEIEVNSTPGQGSEFILTLPVRQQ